MNEKSKSSLSTTLTMQCKMPVAWNTEVNRSIYRISTWNVNAVKRRLDAHNRFRNFSESEWNCCSKEECSTQYCGATAGGVSTKIFKWWFIATFWDWNVLHSRWKTAPWHKLVKIWSFSSMSLKTCLVSKNANKQEMLSNKMVRIFVMQTCLYF